MGLIHWYRSFFIVLFLITLFFFFSLVGEKSTIQQTQNVSWPTLTPTPTADTSYSAPPVNNQLFEQNDQTAQFSGENYILVPKGNGLFELQDTLSEKMTTSEELNVAMNSYRRTHGLNELRQTNELCVHAQQRAKEISADFTHNLFEQHVVNGDYQNTGFQTFGENIWQGSFSAVHIIEYAWDRSEGHKNTQLSHWDAGCAGVYDIFVSFLFAR